MPDGVKWLLSFLGLAALAAWAVTGIVSCTERQNAEYAAMVARCEEKGGVILDRTYTYGKGQTGHEYTCIDRNVIK